MSDVSKYFDLAKVVLDVNRPDYYTYDDGFDEVIRWDNIDDLKRVGDGEEDQDEAQDAPEEDEMAKEATTEPEESKDAPAEDKSEPDYGAMFMGMLKDEDGEVYKAFSQAVKEEVARRVGGSAPAADNSVDDARQLDGFRRMGYKQRLELFESDPDTYNKLNKLDKE